MCHFGAGHRFHRVVRAAGLSAADRAGAGCDLDHGAGPDGGGSRAAGTAARTEPGLCRADARTAPAAPAEEGGATEETETRAAHNADRHGATATATTSRVFGLATPTAAAATLNAADRFLDTPRGRFLCDPTDGPGA